ncbi:unnamed protein product [Brugia timori]|uniref:Uncharacterized protein n=1 Tax=Brugia timori TaxID=42155 RepID=A0A3P7XXR1_9BILA|nr:unnamed protein product [Brugia timori]
MYVSQNILAKNHTNPNVYHLLKNHLITKILKNMMKKMMNTRKTHQDQLILKMLQYVHVHAINCRIRKLIFDKGIRYAVIIIWHIPICNHRHNQLHLSSNILARVPPVG